MCACASQCIKQSDGCREKGAPEPLSSAPGEGKSPAEGAPPQPQLLIERVGGVFQDAVQLILNPSLCHHHQTVQFETHHSAGLPHQLVDPVQLPFLDSSTPAHHGKKQYAGHHRLV